jgi:hypothetical protein
LENQVIEHLIFVEQIQVTESKSGKKNLWSKNVLKWSLLNTTF